MITQFVFLCRCILFLLCVCLYCFYSLQFSRFFIPVILMCSCRILIKITYLLSSIILNHHTQPEGVRPNPTNPPRSAAVSVYVSNFDPNLLRTAVAVHGAREGIIARKS